MHSPMAIPIAPLCDVAVESWRLALRLARLPEQTPGRESMLRSVQRLREALGEVGLEISDPQGQPYSEGLSLDILAFDGHPGHAAGRRTIQETVRPGVRFRGELIMNAQVIVGREGPK
jgi:hypothetical protein